MAVFLSPVGGAGAQFFDNSGNPLSGGKLYTYAAGTTTPQATYTSTTGTVFHTNPIVLDSAGRVPSSGEIWLADNAIYKFVLKTSADVLLATWDQLIGLNSNFVNYTTETEVQTATASQTVFTLTTMTYQPATGSLTVYVDGVNQYEGTSYLETDSTTVTFLTGVHVGALVKFTTAIQTTGNAVDSDVVTYQPAGAGAVATTVQTKLRETVSVKDFGAVGDGVEDDTAAFVAALAAANYISVPPGTYKISTQINITGNKTISGVGGDNHEGLPSIISFTGATGNVFSAISAEYGGICIRNLSILGGNGEYAIRSSRPQSVFENILMEPFNGGGIELFEAGTGNQASWGTMIRQVKWVGPTSATSYRGFQIAINGGHVTLDGCTAAHGTMGINIDQGEAINIYRCSLNLQCNTPTFPYSSEAREQQCSIRLSGAAYKTALSIRECYIEGFTYGIYVEACESLSIEDNYIADLGITSDGYAGAPGSLIYLKGYTPANDYIRNVTIRNNRIAGSGDGTYTISLGEDSKHIEIYNNDIAATGSTGFGGQLPTAVYKETGYLTYIGDNRFRLNPYVGVQYNDANGLLADMFWSRGTFVSSIKGSSTAGTYEIASQTSTYFRFGRSITLNVSVTLAAVVTGGGAGNLGVSLEALGIPTKSGTKSYGSAFLSGVNYATAGASIAAESDGTAHASFIWFAETTDNAAGAYVPISGVSANNVISFSITYEF